MSDLKLCQDDDVRLFTYLMPDIYTHVSRMNTCIMLTLKVPIATKVFCFSRLLKCLRSLYGKQCGPNQTAPIGAVCSGSTLFPSIPNSSVMLGNYLQQTIQQTTFSDALFS